MIISLLLCVAGMKRGPRGLEFLMKYTFIARLYILQVVEKELGYDKPLPKWPIRN